MTNPLAQDLGGVVLLLCPFCGGQPKVGETNTGVPGMEDCGYALVECCIGHAHSEESGEDAIEKWNTRAHSAEIAGALRDAERLNWLDANGGAVRRKDNARQNLIIWNAVYAPSHKTIRGAIDSAMQQGGGGGE